MVNISVNLEQIANQCMADFSLPPRSDPTLDGGGRL